jgi:hypothetical protein
MYGSNSRPGIDDSVSDANMAPRRGSNRFLSRDTQSPDHIIPLQCAYPETLDRARQTVRGTAPRSIHGHVEQRLEQRVDQLPTLILTGLTHERHERHKTVRHGHLHLLRRRLKGLHQPVHDSRDTRIGRGEMWRRVTKQDDPDDRLFDLVPVLFAELGPARCVSSANKTVQRPIAQRLVPDEKPKERPDLRRGEQRGEPLKSQHDRDARRPWIRVIQTCTMTIIPLG